MSKLQALPDDMMTDSLENTASWQHELESTGRVEFHSSYKQAFKGLVIPCAIVVVFLLIGYTAGEIPIEGFLFGTVGIPAIVVGILLYVRMRQGGMPVVVELHGITTIEGLFIPWTEISEVDYYSPPRSAPTVRLIVSESAWQKFLETQTGGARGLNRFNSFVLRKQFILLPSALQVPLRDLAVWLNQFPTGLQKFT